MIGKRRKPFPGARGMFDKNFPHDSYSQIAQRMRCPSQYEWIYKLGHKMEGLYLELGAVLHEGAREINELAKNSADGIGPDELAQVLSHPRLTTFRDFGSYKSGCFALQKYAEMVNEDRRTIIDLEMPVQFQVEVLNRRTKRKRLVKFNSVIDRIDRLKDTRYRFWDYKLVGAIRSREELKKDIQMNLYNLQIRRHYGYQGEIVCFYFSLLTGRITECVFDESDAVATERFVIGSIGDQLADTKFEARFNDRCWECGRRSWCAEFKRHTAWTESQILEPTLRAYVESKAAIKVFTERKKMLGDMLGVRIDQEGPEIIEEGWTAYYSHHPAHTVAAHDVAASEVLSVTRSVRSGRMQQQQRARRAG
ncbi:hypothetical protein LCGC14_0441520 [marine sediment metagenome]|uniref:PD-(D/E)XK endonuclease-like domain-containing protein n=1 Tax=marine sediment metagenome TaxID=412755 RepID=A0A0F9SKB5_9ZZZZ